MATGHHGYCECRACRTVYRSRTRSVRGQIRALLVSAEKAVEFCPSREDVEEAEEAVLEAWKLDSFEAGFEFEIDRVKKLVRATREAQDDYASRGALRSMLSGGVL